MMMDGKRWLNPIKAIVLLVGLSMSGIVGADTHHSDSMIINLGSLQGTVGYRIDGRANGDRAGNAIGNAGDVNGDGLDDFIIGAASASPDGKQNAGEAYVVFGRTTNPASFSLNDLNGNNGFRIVGTTYNDELGQSVQGGGDVNTDGYADLIVGAPGADPADESPEAGSVFVIFGRPAFASSVNVQTLTGSNGFRISSSIENNRIGTSAGHAGDVNGDGYDDIFIGAPDATTSGKAGAGQAFVVFGRSAFSPSIDVATLDGTTGFQILGSTAESYAGRVVSSAGDLNSDGYDDILLTAWKYTTARSLESGTVFVMFGKPDFESKYTLNAITGTTGFRIEGIAIGDNAGRSASAAGDVNGDGRDDLLIGAPYAAAYKGEAYVVYGQATFPNIFNLSGLNGANGFRMTGADANGEVGTAVGAADLNGDGLQDVVIGASLAGLNAQRFAGKTYVVLGKSDFGASLTLDSPAQYGGLLLEGATAGDQTGQAVSLAGDVNGDGFDEILIGAPNAGPGFKSDMGYTYLLSGGPTLGVTLPVTHNGTPNNDTLNGTGSNDVMVAGRGHDQVIGMAGADSLKGGSGNDTLTGAAGGDRLIGGNGIDGASYTGSSSGVSIDLFTGAANGGDASGDYLRSIERLIGSPHADTLNGDQRNNQLEGGPGNDQLTGGGGDDAFRFGPHSGNDTIADFTPGPASDDYLDFNPYPSIEDTSDLVIVAQEADTLITLPGGETITLLNVAPGRLHGDDYRFVGAPLAVPDYYNTPVNTPLTVSAPGVLGNDDNPSTNPLTAALVTGPNHGQVNLQSGGGFTYTPQTSYVGTDEFSYRTNNGRDSNVTRVVIEITLSPPVAANDEYNVEIGDTLTIPAPGVLENDTSIGGAALEAFLVGEPVEGNLVFNDNGSFTYEPGIDYSARDTFTYQASNGLSSNIAVVTINILDPDGPPIALDDTYSLKPNTTLTVNAPGVLANDVNPLPGPMSATLETNPTNGTVSFQPDGSFSYTPRPGFEGVDSFTYLANNGQLSNAAVVNLVVTTASGNYQLYLPIVLRR